MTEEKFKSCMAFLIKYFRFELTEEYNKMYWKMLNHLDDDKFQLCCQNIIKDFAPTHAVPFPLIVHFLRACGESGDAQAIAAISKLKKTIGLVGQYNSVNFHDLALHYVINAFGGWTSISLCNAEFWDINEKRMVETYKVATMNKSGDEGHLPGLAEQHNGFYRIYSINQVGKCIESKLYKGQLPSPEQTKKLESANEIMQRINL